MSHNDNNQNISDQPSTNLTETPEKHQDDDDNNKPPNNHLASSSVPNNDYAAQMPIYQDAESSLTHIKSIVEESVPSSPLLTSDETLLEDEWKNNTTTTLINLSSPSNEFSSTNENNVNLPPIYVDPSLNMKETSSSDEDGQPMDTDDRADNPPISEPAFRDEPVPKEEYVPDKKPLINDVLDKSVVDALCQFRADKKWLDRQYHGNDQTLIKKPDEVQTEMDEPPGLIDEHLLNRIQGSIIGMALGDALGAHVEFRPHQYMLANPVTDLESGGTWGLHKGQFTDDTSMALCLANSLVTCRAFVPYDQLVRYKWWYRNGYMSSTGKCFDIGAATSQSIQQFENRQDTFAKKNNISREKIDYLSDSQLLDKFNVYCSEDGVAGNGALMRLAPVPLFLHRYPAAAVELSGRSGRITHGDKKAYDACRYYGALIVAALHDYSKEQILDDNFYSKHKQLFGDEPLHPDIQSIANGSYKKDGYKAGIRGKGYIVNALEAALWAFWSDKGSFKKGALAAVNLGDDTDTTAAIYGQLAGAYYGYKALPGQWLHHVYAKTFMEKLSKWIAYEGEHCLDKKAESVCQE